FTPEQIQKYALNLLSSQNIGIYINKDPDSKALEILKYAIFIELDYNLIDKTTIIKEQNPDVPIIIRLPINKNVEESVNSLVKNKIDGIHLYADYHGNSFDETNSKFIIEYIRLIHNKLVENGIRNQLSIIVSGGIILAEHVPKAIICGADLVGIDTSTLVALQTKIIGECTSSITGKIKQEKIDVNWGSQRLVNLFASWYNQIIEVLSAMGMRDIRRLRGEVGRAIFKAEIEEEAFDGIEGFGG
ncbi:MAG: glutamate synthase-related protein, partial [Candidatus Kariarchaeaceae archaeon]